MLRTVIFLIFTHVDEYTLLIVFPVLHSGSLVVVDSQYTCVYVMPNFWIILASIFHLCGLSFVVVSLFLSWKWIYSMKFYILPMGDILSLYLALSYNSQCPSMARSIHIVNWHYFMVSHGWEVLHCIMYQTFFNRSSVNGHFDSFWVLDIVNHAAVNIEVWLFLHNIILFADWSVVELASHRVPLFIDLWGTCILLSTEGLPVHIVSTL